MQKLTLDILKKLPKHEIFTQGTFIDSPADINIAKTGMEVRWVAQTGEIGDWCIYCQNPFYLEHDGVWHWSRIEKQGDKIMMEKHIRKLVPCDDEAFKQYRY